jgi:cell division protein FtsQ
VSRDWDSGIVTVKVEERSAILDADLDGRRRVVALDGTELPGLGGERLGSVKVDGDQLEDILGTGRVLKDEGVALDSVNAVNAGGFEATVRGRSVIFSGVVREEQARALTSVMEKHPDAPFFDLRSPERIIVGVENESGRDPTVKRDG